MVLLLASLVPANIVAPWVARFTIIPLGHEHSEGGAILSLLLSLLLFFIAFALVVIVSVMFGNLVINRYFPKYP